VRVDERRPSRALHFVEVRYVPQDTTRLHSPSVGDIVMIAGACFTHAYNKELESVAATGFMIRRGA
jgi:hypothetical protein